MKVNYVPFCYKYKKNSFAPFWLKHSSYGLAAYVVAIAEAQDHGLTYLATGAAIGCFPAIAGVRPVQFILKKLKAHPVRGSIMLQRMQFVCVALGVCVGGGLEYKNHKFSTNNHSPSSIEAVLPEKAKLPSIPVGPTPRL